ncbi:hypothetical protein ACFXGA_36355 [Actinosynnema sp. NPDC059335]|uniref:hypothetical protein n=1 Tax=Actinosynnema sp. NPDC059335 TaxID=3346804 RepID=UPI00366B9C98
MDETLVAERERAKLRRVVDLVRRGLRSGTTRGARPDRGWVMSADGVIGAPAAADDQPAATPGG